MSLDSNWDLYKTFYAVAKYNSFSKAADELYISQPSISYSIKQLESNLGIKLFYRKPNGVKLTADGQELLNYVEKSYRLLLSGERKMTETKELIRGRISIGVQSHIGEFFLFPIVEKFHQDYPNIEINIISRNTEQMVDLLEDNNIDFIIDTSPIKSIYNNIKILPLCDLDNIFISKYAPKQENNSLHDFKEYNLILPVKRSTPRRQLDAKCEEIGIELNPFMTIETTEMMINAIKKNMGIGYVIKQAVSKDIKEGNLYEVKVKEELPKLELNLVYIDEYLTHIPRYFMNKIKNEYEEYMK